MIFRLKSEHQVKTSVNSCDRNVLLTNSNQDDYCRVILSPSEARRIAEQLVSLADELDEIKQFRSERKAIKNVERK